MAGESAVEVARRARQKAERLNRRAEMYERGAAGEAATAHALTALPASEWVVLHDVRWPGRARANIDHVVIGPSGVYVVDSKNWSGRVYVKDGVLRQNGYQREREVNGVAEAALAVTQVTAGLDPRLVHPVICLTRDGACEEVSRGVSICSTANVVAQISARPVVLRPDEVTTLAAALELGLARAEAAAPCFSRHTSAL